MPLMLGVRCIELYCKKARHIRNDNAFILPERIHKDYEIISAAKSRQRIQVTPFVPLYRDNFLLLFGLSITWRGATEFTARERAAQLLKSIAM